ncbi:MAG: hypothetical protein IJ229_04170 [Clostridia bacterium]|nr:hypothetical protein [Clostridia bacterium]MBR1685107.1 hypothetical protein [Clostridia bacterium]MBR2287569.1 hypothetical protein [Clostridia bacterium]
MGFVLCPRCELNYMKDTDTYCDICTQELRGTAPRDEVELCSICNENPVLPGRDVCAACLHELQHSGKVTSTDDGDDGEVDADAISDIDTVGGMEDIMPLDTDDRDYGDIEHALSLESVREDEERDLEDEDDNER